MQKSKNTVNDKDLAPRVVDTTKCVKSVKEPKIDSESVVPSGTLCLISSNRNVCNSTDPFSSSGSSDDADHNRSSMGKGLFVYYLKPRDNDPA